MIVATPPRSILPVAEEPGIEWEDAPCPQCGNMLSRPVLEAADNAPASGGLRFGVVQCLRCDLWYTNPRPGPNSIGRFYPDDYHPHRAPRRPRSKWLPGREWLSRCLGRPCRERHSLPIVGQGRLLDFGCGNGEFLLRMRERGWQVAGLDSSAKVIQLLRREHGLCGHIGSLPHPDLAPGSFDVITMWASLEHVHRPLQVLREAHRLLAPGGRLYVEVHNVESWGLRLFGPHWFSLDLPRHLTHFSPATLRRILLSAGFRTHGVRYVSHPSTIGKSLRIAREAGAARPGHHLLAIKPVRLLWSWFAHITGGSDHLFACAERPE